MLLKKLWMYIQLYACRENCTFFFLTTADSFFSLKIFQKSFWNTIPTVIQIMFDILLGLIWVQTAFKSCLGKQKKSATSHRSFELNNDQMQVCGVLINSSSTNLEILQGYFNPLLHNNAFWHLWNTTYFENIMENGAFAPKSKCSIFHNIFKSIQNFS